MEELVNDDRFNTVEKQRVNRTEIVELLDKKFSEKTYQEWSDIFSQTNLAYERIAHFIDVIDDPQSIENRFFLERNYKSGKQVNIPAPPFNIYGVEEEDLSRTIHHGEHTREVLNELGYSSEEIEYMKQNRIVYEMEEVNQ